MQVSNLIPKGTYIGKLPQRKSVHSYSARGRQLAPVNAVPNIAGPAFTELAQDLSTTLSPEVQQAGLLVGAVVAAGSLVVGGYMALKNEGEPIIIPEAGNTMGGAAPPPPPPRENAVLVIGAAGRTGRQTVQQLLRSGRTVVAALRTADKSAAAEAMGSMGIQEGVQAGVQRAHVVTCLGGKFGKQPDGSMGYIDGCTPEAVEARGVQNLVAAMSEHVPKQTSLQYQAMMPEAAGEQGGQSSSLWEPAPDHGPHVARWKGDLIVEGGGFCGARTKPLQQTDWSAFDGIALRVKGDGQIFKFNIKTLEQVNTPESTYQATFDTVDGQWHDVLLPWHNFVPVKRAQSDPDGAPLDPSKIVKLGTVLSRFEFNKMPNPSYRPGPFQLLMDGGVRAYKAPRPQIVMVSSAGVERNAIVGDDAERRKKQIPIVQLNPGATLNHKYAGEIAIRSSGYPYCVIRSTGMTDNTEGAPFLLEADQGDFMSGAVGRDELGMLITAALAMPDEIVADVQRIRQERGVQPQTEANLATAKRQ
ncbi:complex I intermediate-associated protein 30-domain-containing protein [Dunaliella salina]|uniref:Complex I intermediate-associated protein 30-domain-containing protein n=1 Tax=Dunaliella salina TaxID=3046 RepID=A0ABQ7GIH9_DUNSA|nr:complex I intermediate-associated protein 30-domain-containing protein [Dunaliella salina]|eukprot:KAF5834423.1 complex I intermediate-associated protein 30-domain-containing protein [Dunaliella salina]